MSPLLSIQRQKKRRFYSQKVLKNWTFKANWRIKVPYCESFSNFILEDKPMIQALRNTFDGARGQAASAVLAAGTMVASLGTAHAQDIAAANQDQAAQTQGMTGKPVILRVGPGFSTSAADGIADVLNDEGCPTTVLKDGFIPDSIDVEVDGGTPANFSQTGSAGSFALEECTRDS